MNKLDFWRSNLTPWSDWGRTQKSLEKFFEGFPNTKWRDENAYLPSCEVTEDKTSYHFKFDLPGMSKEQVRIELHENQLTVTGERKEEKNEDTKRYHFSEMNYGTFTRTFALPANVDAEKVEAKFENGVLNININKMEASKARQVNIK